MIQEVTIYRTDDGSEFRTRDAASAYQGRAYRVAAIMTVLPERPRGHGRYIQHTRDAVEPVAAALLELIEERTGEHAWITQTRQKGLVDAHPSFVGRLIGDYDDKALNGAWMRMQCIDWHTLREYDQPYFAAHPNEASGPEERA